MPTLRSTIHRRGTMPQAWRSHLGSAWPWERCGAAVGAGGAAGAEITFRSTTTTTSIATRTSIGTSTPTATSQTETRLGITIRSIAEEPRMGIGQPRTDMAEPREVNLWPTVKPQPGSKCLPGKAVLLPIGLREPAVLAPPADPRAPAAEALGAAVEVVPLDHEATTADRALAPRAVAVPPAWVREAAVFEAAVEVGADSSIMRTRSTVRGRST